MARRLARGLTMAAGWRRCAIVGGGLASLVCFGALRAAGVEPGEIAVLGVDGDPAATWRRRAGAIHQQRMRSESDGHCASATFPGLAVRAALRRRSAAPLLSSLWRGYRPSVLEFLEHVDESRAAWGWDESFRVARVERVTAVEGGFALDDLGAFRHVLLAPGHPGLSWPEELAGDPRAVHAYEAHDYGERVAVVGAGMAAATEWLNALAAGASVVSVRRREPVRRPLNIPRPYFSRRGLAGYHASPPADRAALLERLLEPSYPPGRDWDEPLLQARRAGRFRVCDGRAGTEGRDTPAGGSTGHRLLDDVAGGSTGRSLLDDVAGADRVICATGFLRGYGHDPLLAGLVREHGLEREGARIVLAPDATVPALTDGSRTLALAGVHAQLAFPAADTLAGARYVGHRFARRVIACPTR